MKGFGLGISVIVALFDTVDPAAEKVALSVTGMAARPNIMSSRKVMEKGKVKRCGDCGNVGSSGMQGRRRR